MILLQYLGDSVMTNVPPANKQGIAQYILFETIGTFSQIKYDPDVNFVLLFDPSTTTDTEENKTAAVVGSVVAAIVVLAAASTGGVWYWKHKQAIENPAYLTEMDSVEAVELQAAAAASSAKLSEVVKSASAECTLLDVIQQNPDMKNRMASVNVIPLESVKLLNELGRGSFGAVYMGFHDGRVVAVKQLQVTSQNQLEEFLNEASIMSSLKPHRHVCAIHGITIDAERRIYSLVVEFCPNGSLEFAIKSWPQRAHVVDFAIFKILYGSALGLQFLNSSGVIHRDIAMRCAITIFFFSFARQSRA